MPTDTGAETIGERLARKRGELADARAVVTRSRRNGASFDVGGTAVTQIAIDRAREDVDRLESEIKTLEARLGGGRRKPGLARTVSRVD